MTPYAVFATAFLAPIAVALIVSAVLRTRGGRTVGRWRVAAAVASGLFLAVAMVAAAGWAMPDAFDALPTDEQRAIGPALDSAPECGGLPFARVLSVEVHDSREQGPTLRYTCGLTHLGLPRFSNSAECADGKWRGPGLLETWTAGDCSGRTP